ncbi:hypothetical protein [Kluyvera genomosp. 2]|uniref:hypothetical protein n=1 Tax=Kluyvera genomosp. 2 TaxID=2774054 RepID=UPI001CC3BEC3|nr:hypothetical protein [Kluyvera genomosp. 2]
MSTITKERLEQLANFRGAPVTRQEEQELARIALASLEAEPAGWQVKKHGGDWVSIKKEDVDHYRFNEDLPVREVYTAPPAPVSVPAAMEMDDDFDSAFEHGKAVGWNAYRAAMLQSFGNSEQLNSPVIQDGYVLVPKRLTAENGAKTALIGEFNLEYSLTCHECFGEGCDDCSGEGTWINTIPVDWSTIKDIWANAIDHFTAAPQQEVK